MESCACGAMVDIVRRAPTSGAKYASMVTPPSAQLFVCANTRDPSSPLGAGCGARGEAVYAALKEEVARRGLIRSVWVTKTHCLGICPRAGCSVASYPARTFAEGATPADAQALLDEATSAAAAPTWDELEALLADMEELQAGKVIDLARRLKPGLTAEDVKNPHDFPELSDPDWHYADGHLTGIQSVRSALAARRRGRLP